VKSFSANQSTDRLFNSPVQFLFPSLKLMHFSYQIHEKKNRINCKFCLIFQLKNKAKSILYSQKHSKKVFLSFYLKMF